MEIEKMYPDINPYTRPGYPIQEHRGVLMHWTATPRATAENIRNAFDRNIFNRVFASANYIIGIDGETIEYVPPDEIAYHGGSVSPEYYTEAARRLWEDHPKYVNWHETALNIWAPYYWLIGVEMCHETMDGKFTPATLYAAKELLIDLWEQKDMGDPVTHTLRHTDVTQKGVRGFEGELPCPRWWVEHPEDWLDFRMYTKEAICNAVDRLRGKYGAARNARLTR